MATLSDLKADIDRLGTKLAEQKHLVLPHPRPIPAMVDLLLALSRGVEALMEAEIARKDKP